MDNKRKFNLNEDIANYILHNDIQLVLEQVQFIMQIFT